MRIALASDHAGFKIRGKIRRHLEDLKHEVVDLGCNSEESCDYPDFAQKVAEAVQKGECDRGILLCGTGMGMAIVANKFSGIRAAVVCSDEMARLASEHNDANIICIGARLNREQDILKMIDVWLKTLFEGERHIKRIAKIDELEKRLKS